MIEEQVRVVAIEAGQLLLEAQVKSACGSCGAQKGCGTAVLSKVVGKKFTRFRVKNTVNAQVGDNIIIGLPEQALLSGSLLIYLLPLLGMIVMALLADAILVPDASARDLSIAVFAFSGFGLSLLLARWFLSSARSRLKYTPVVIKKLVSTDRLADSFPVKCTEV